MNIFLIAILITITISLYALYHVNQTLDRLWKVENEYNQQQNESSSTNDHQDMNKAAVPFAINGVPVSHLYEPGHSESNSDLCGPDAGKQIRLLILIASKPTNFDHRLDIRQTWGHYATRHDIAMAFVIGATDNQSIENSLKTESYWYRDIIRGHFIDSYQNLTFKSISMLEWADTYCSRAEYILKSDDDMFVNVLRLMSFIDTHPLKQQQKVIFGYIQIGSIPFRNQFSKYYASNEEYFPSVYPDYLMGTYLISGSAIHDLYKKALEQIFFKIEDIFVTGMVAPLVNAERIHVEEFLIRNLYSFDTCSLRNIIITHMGESYKHCDLWNALIDTKAKCN